MKRIIVNSIILIFAMVYFGCGSANTPPDVAKEFLTKIEKGDKGAVNLMHSGLISMMGKEKLEKGLMDESEKMNKKGGIASIDILEEKINEDDAVLKVKVNYKDGSNKTEKMNLIKENGDWKITVSK